MQNILTFISAHWAAILGTAAATNTLAVSVANFFPGSKAATIIHAVYDGFNKVVGLVQPLVLRNSPVTPTSTDSK